MGCIRTRALEGLLQKAGKVYLDKKRANLNSIIHTDIVSQETIELSRNIERDSKIHLQEAERDSKHAWIKVWIMY